MRSKDRFCAYCGEGKCRCSYRAGRRGLSSITVHNTCIQTSMGEMRQEFEDVFGRIDPETPGMWSISFTKLDQPALDKFLAKKATKNG